MNQGFYPEPSGSGAGLIIAIIVVLLLLVGGGIAAYFLLKPKPGTTVGTGTGSTTPPPTTTTTPPPTTTTTTAPPPPPVNTCDAAKDNAFMQDWIVNKYWAFDPKARYGCPARGFKVGNVYIDTKWVPCGSRQDCYDKAKHAEHFRPEGARGVNMADVEQFVNY